MRVQDPSGRLAGSVRGNKHTEEINFGEEKLFCSEIKFL